MTHASSAQSKATALPISAGVPMRFMGIQPLSVQSLSKRSIERTMDRFDLYPARLAGDSAYGSAEMLRWLVYQHGIEPPVRVRVFDKSARRDGTFSREEFTHDLERDVVCPAGKTRTTRGTLVNDGATLLYRASKFLKRPAEPVVKSTAGAARRSSGSARARPRCAGRGCRALPSGPSSPAVLAGLQPGRLPAHARLAGRDGGAAGAVRGDPAAH
jgi:hypothetical protein